MFAESAPEALAESEYNLLLLVSEVALKPLWLPTELAVESLGEVEVLATLAAFPLVEPEELKPAEAESLLTPEVSLLAEPLTLASWAELELEAFPEALPFGEELSDALVLPKEELLVPRLPETEGAAIVEEVPLASLKLVDLESPLREPEAEEEIPAPELSEVALPEE